MSFKKDNYTASYYSVSTFLLSNVKDTHREKAPSNKTPAVRKSTDMTVWPVGTLNQLFIRDSLTETKLSKKQSICWQKSVFCDRSIL